MTTLEGFILKDAGIDLQAQLISDQAKRDYIVEHPLDSPEEEWQIIDVFAQLLLEAQTISGRGDRDTSEIVDELKLIYAKAEAQYNKIDKLSGLKRLRSTTLEVFFNNGMGPDSIKLNRIALKRKIKTEFLDRIIKLEKFYRGKELLAKRNWQERAHSNQSLRTKWLNTWLDNLLVQATSNEDMQRQLESIALFADERVNVIDHHGKRVVFLDWDREFQISKTAEGKSIVPHPAVELLIADPGIQSVMIEYFSPELKANFRGENLPEKLRQHPLVKKIILALQSHALKQVNGTDHDAAKTYKRRLFGFDAISQMCIQHKKDVMVGDIADSYQYMIARDLLGIIWKIGQPLGLLGLAAGGVYAIFLGEDVHKLLQSLTVAGSSLSWFIASVVRKRMFIDRGILALEPNVLEKLYPHLEDARRLFLANAVDRATQLRSNSDESNNTTLVIYPPAHNNRIMDYLEKPAPARQKYYKVLNPYLNYNLRQYSHDEASRNETAKIYSGWSLVKRTPLN